MEKLISVIIPVYNVEKYLEQCLNSVVSQTYQNLQIILVDDGSTDHSSQICDQYMARDHRIQVIHQENQGLPAARNRGLTSANGEYIGFVDSDDWIHPEMYQHLVEILEANDADISTVECVKTSGEIPEGNDKDCIEVLNQQDFARRFLKIGYQKILYYVWNRLYKREILEEQHFEEAFSIGEDVVASWKAILHAKRIVISSSVMYYYRQMSGMTSKFGDKYFQLQNVWERVGEITDQLAPEYRNYVTVNQDRINFTLLSELAVSGAFKYPEYQEKVSELLQTLKKRKCFLLRSDIAFSRKILIIGYCLNYRLCAELIHKIKDKRNK